LKHTTKNSFGQIAQIYTDILELIRGNLRYLREKMTSLFFVLSFFSFSQDNPFRQQSFFANVGLNIFFGTHVNRIGVVINAGYIVDHFQANAETRAYFNLRNLGPRKKYTEMTASLGVLYGYGKMYTWYNPFYNSVSNQTGYRYAFAYSYNRYWNKIRTSQGTGIIALQFDKITVINENDLLAPPSLDAFRTGGLLVQFQQDNLFQAAISSAMWTGKMGFRTKSDDPHFRFGCYMDTTGSIYPNYSHGILSAQIKYSVGYGQNAQANIGIDAEQVRNVIQNEVTHDMSFLPRNWVKSKNCHIPMLDEKGSQYLFKEGQKIKPAKFFFEVGGNQNLFY
jgi:hypothetical protein